MKASAMFRLTAALIVVAMAALLGAGTALAHGHVEVGKYELVIGFSSEPAIQGEPNGLDLRVSVRDSGEPVVGLEETLQAEIGYGASSRPLELRARWGQEGAYTADILPTEAGDYSFRIFGTIEGEPVDISMTSSPDTFSAVETKAAIAFPAAEPTAAELAAATAAAQQTAQIALAVGGLGLALGVAGLTLGLRARRAAQSRPAEPARGAA